MILQTTSAQHTNGQHGLTLPLAMIATAALIGIVGLALDTAMTLLAVRDAQRTSDAASLAGVNTLQNLSPIQGWRDAKKAVLAAFSINRIIGLDSTAVESLASATNLNSFRYDDETSSKTPLDPAGYDHNTGKRGNLHLTVVRGLFCYDAEPGPPVRYVRRWYSLEKQGYCYANSVHVHTQIDNIPTSFMRVLGIALVPKIQVTSVSYIKPPDSCGFPLCNSIGTPDSTSDEIAQHLLPTIACP